MAGYDFRSLSPSDFELLACDVLNTDQGLALHGYPPGRDGGIDLRHVEASAFTTIVQCKHYRDSSTPTFLRELAKELDKPAIRTADRYILVTSHPLTPGREQEVATLLGISIRDVWGPDRINRVLREHPQIERRHFKLWLNSATVLGQVLHAGLWRRTEALLHEMVERAKYWVDIPAYVRASELLEQEGVCIIAGGPGVGKTFLAERLMLEALRNGWEVVNATGDIDAAWGVAEPEGRRLFYIDDFLGEAVLRHDAADNASELLDFVSYVGRHKDRLRLVMTTREQVCTQAAHAGSDRLNRLAQQPARCVLTLSELDEATRTEILLSHVHQSDLPAEERAKLADDNRIKTLAAHHAFSPRLIRSVLTDRRLSGDCADSVLRLLTAVFADPAELWRTSFEALDEPTQRILLTLMTFPARPLLYRELQNAAALDRSTLTWLRSFRTLEPAWIHLVGPPDRRSVAFANPGCRDFLLGLLELGEGALARDLVGAGLGRLEQLISLSQEAGLLTSDGVVPLVASAARPALRGVLMEHRTQLSARIEQLWREEEGRGDGALGPRLLRLRDAAALVACYGAGDEGDSAWLLLEIETLLDNQAAAIPCIPALALARRLQGLSAEPYSAVHRVAHRLIIAALAHADVLHDLDAYEDLPAVLRTAATRQVAVQRAAHIIEDEVDRLTHETVDPAELKASVRDLSTWAAWYSLDFDFTPLLDLIDELDLSEDVEKP